MAIQKGGIMKKNDPNYIVKVEKAIAEKYGQEAIDNPKAHWTDEKEKEYVKQLKDLITTNEKIRNLSSAINVSRAQKELGTKDIKDPIEISKALKRTERGQ